MKFASAHLNFSEQYLQATLFVSLLSVWLLVGLFYYLNRYTKREYFTVWTTAWLFYALWLTLGLTMHDVVSNKVIFMLRQCCVAISAVFLLWGSARFLSLPIRQTSFGLFMLFLLAWTFISTQMLSSSLQIELPVFILIGLSSVFAGVCFYRVRKKMPFVGAGMLSMGFLLWGLYLGSFPFSQEYQELYNAGFLIAAVLQLFIAVSMVVLVMEEVRYNAEQMRAEIAEVRSEKEALQVKILTTEEQCRSLYDQVRLTEGVQKAYDELRRTQQVVVQQERLRALGQMASGVAHDVNNALSPIVAYSELLLATQTNLPNADPPVSANHPPGRRGRRAYCRAHAGILPPALRHGGPGQSGHQPDYRRSHRVDPPSLARSLAKAVSFHTSSARIGAPVAATAL